MVCFGNCFSAVVLINLFLLLGNSTATGAERVKVPDGCWDAKKNTELEDALDAFFAEANSDKRRQAYTTTLHSMGTGLSLSELETIAAAKPPEGKKHGRAWRIQAPWSPDNKRAWFNLTLPEGYTPTRSWGLVMVLHSGPTGRNGDNLVSFYSPAVNNAGYFAVYPTILFDKHLWDNRNEMVWVYRTLDWVARRYRIDFRKLVVSGGSAGGMATWNHLALRLEVWSAGAAAAAPPWLKSDQYHRFKDIPLYLVIGENDNRSIGILRKAVKQLDAMGAKHVYKEIKGSGHSLSRGVWNEMVAWIPRQPSKPFSPRPVILPPENGQRLWQRIVDPLNTAGDPVMKLLRQGKYAEAQSVLSRRIADNPGQAGDRMLRALARLPGLDRPLPAGLDPGKLPGAKEGWTAASESGALRDLKAALGCKKGKGDDPSEFEATVHLYTARIYARQFSLALSKGGYGWVSPFNRAGAELRACFMRKRSMAGALALSRALHARLPEKMKKKKKNR